MKTLKIIGFLLLTWVSLKAQDETLFSTEIESSGYVAPLVKITEMNGGTNILMGFHGGWVINHQFVMGGKFYMLTNPYEVSGLQNISAGFFGGGAYFEYITKPDKLLHYSYETVIGPCMVYNDVTNYAEEHDPIAYTGEMGLIIEPGFNLMINVTKNVRFGAGTSYRFVTGIDYDAGAPYQTDNSSITSSDLCGLNTQIFIKFGSF